MSSSSDNNNNNNNNNNDNNNNKKKKPEEEEETDDVLKSIEKYGIPGVKTTKTKGPIEIMGEFLPNYEGYTNLSEGKVTLELENKSNEFFIMTVGEGDEVEQTQFHRFDANELSIDVVCTITLQDGMLARIFAERLLALTDINEDETWEAALDINEDEDEDYGNLEALDIYYSENNSSWNPKEIRVTMTITAEKQYVGWQNFSDQVDTEIGLYRNDGLGGLLLETYSDADFWNEYQWPVYNEELQGFEDVETQGLPANSYIMDYHYFESTLQERIFPVVGEVMAKVFSEAFGPQMVGVTTRFIGLEQYNDNGEEKYRIITQGPNETEEASAERKERSNLLSTNTWYNPDMREGYIDDLWNSWLFFNVQLEIDDPRLFEAPELEVQFLIHNIVRERMTGKQKTQLLKF